MNLLKHHRVKNAMLLANFISNVIGVSVVQVLVRSMERPQHVADIGRQIDSIFLPCAFFMAFVVTLTYERPYRLFLNRRYRGEPVSDAAALQARKRLLNEPFFLIALDLFIWMFAAVLYSAVFWTVDADRTIIHGTFLRSIYTGLITTTVAFFVFEHVLQRRVTPHFFPNGGLFMTPGTMKIRISTRLMAFLFAINLIPFFSVLTQIWGSFGDHTASSYGAAQMQSHVLQMAFLFMGVGLWLTYLVSSNLTRPLGEIIQVLRKVRNGIFEDKVRVTSNDEIGYAGDVINEMTEGLQERDLVKDLFGRYVSKEIRDEILSGNIPLDGELKEVTVLFADLRDFTPMVEELSPKEVVKIINGYFAEMDDAIRQNGGLVLQYIGDEIEAVFGAPIHQEGHPLMAVRAAMEMNSRLRTYNEVLRKQGRPPLYHGIGIHTGEALAANIGSPERLSYALVGDTVNLASRLQGLNKDFGTEILLSASTQERLNGEVGISDLGAAEIKGKTGSVQLFAVRG
jgi:adenylate cyclase